MLRFVLLLAATVALTWSAPNPANVFEIDISPEEAQKFLNSPPFTDPQLSGRTAVLPLVRWNDPSFRAAEAGPTLGHYWRNGQEIENTQDYVEEVYDASQFHGQDGLGGYAYGYQGPDSSKVENRQRSGDVAGSYTFSDGNNGLIKVRYWADSEGFHQEDNIPKVQLEPAQETQEVREARLAHEKAWQEAAAAAAQQPDPQGEYSAQYEYQGSASEPKGAVAAVPAPQGQGQPQDDIKREGKAYYASAQSSYQSGGQGVQKNQYSQQQYQSQGQQGQKYQGQSQGQNQANDEEVEPTGPPRGFFYSFNYPVSVIVPKSQQQGGPVNPGHPVDHDTVAINVRG